MKKMSGSRASRLNGFQTKLVSLVFALFLILRNVQRETVVDTSFCPSYYGSSSLKKKKTYRGEEKSGSRQLSRRSFSSLQLQDYFQPTKCHNLDFFTRV